MKYIKYGYASFTRHIGIYLIVILQVSVLLIAVNIIIGNYNSKEMLYKPFEDLLEKEGYYISDFEGQSFDMLNIKGEYEKLTIYEAFVVSEQGSAKAYIIPDEFYKKLSLPLISGDFSQAVITNNNIIKTSDMVYIGGVPVKISGMLTSKSYLLNFGGNSDYSNDVTKFYTPYDSENPTVEELYYGAEKTHIIMVPFSALGSVVENQKEIFTKNAMSIVVFSDNLSQEDKSYNDTLLKENAHNYYYIPLEKMRESTDIYLNENTRKILPIIIGTGIIAFMGILCCCAISVSQNLKNYAIYYISGASLKDCIIVNTFTNLIIQAISGLILILSLNVIKLYGIDLKIGFVFGRNNYIFSIAMLLSIFVFSQIISVSVLKRRTPRDILISKVK